MAKLRSTPALWRCSTRPRRSTSNCNATRRDFRPRAPRGNAPRRNCVKRYREQAAVAEFGVAALGSEQFNVQVERSAEIVCRALDVEICVVVAVNVTRDTIEVLSSAGWTGPAPALCDRGPDPHGPGSHGGTSAYVGPPRRTILRAGKRYSAERLLRKSYSRARASIHATVSPAMPGWQRISGRGPMFLRN